MEPKKPWQKVAWSEDIQQRMYRDWGIYLSFEQQYDTATKYYNKSLDIQGDDVKALYYRSVCKSDIADAEAALKDAKLALSFNDMHHPVNLQVCDALYELNNFEDCKIELSNKSRKFIGRKKEPFKTRIDVVEQNFLDSLGEYLGPFFLRNSKHLVKIVEKLNKLKNVDDRPLWKILQEQGECDVVSVLEKEEKLLHPREVARRALCFRVFCQVYFRKLWVDVDFLKLLKKHPILLLPQTKRSTPFLAEFVKKQYDTVIKFLKMLEARSPLYTETFKMCSNQKLAAKMKQDHLFRVQYQTRRDMFIILEKATMLREKGQLDKLIKFIEHSMGDYVILKTRRVMPRKFEFINEIYNILGLAYLDTLYVPDNLIQIRMSDRLFVLMGLPTEKDRDPIVPFVFGDKSTYQVPDAPDYGYIAYKKLVTRLEKRLRFADYPIEKSYLLHETAKNHLQQSKFDECLSLAKKSIEEAELCSNHLWIFLATLMLCKVNVTQRKIERLKASLEKASLTAVKLKEPRIIHFMETCTKMNDMLLDLKKKSSSTDLLSRPQG